MQDYDTFKRGKAKEITSLKKDSRRAETEMRRLALLNQKQKSVLQRKIQEAEEAKKRLQSLKHRSAKRTTPAATNGAVVVPSRPVSVASSRGTGHPSITPFGSAASGAHVGAGGGGSTGSGAGSLAVAAVDSVSAAPSVGDGRDPKDWLREEIESVSTAHYTRVVMQGTIAKRGDLSKRVKEYERKVSEIDHLPEEQQVLHTMCNSCCVQDAVLGFMSWFCSDTLPHSSIFTGCRSCKTSTFVSASCGCRNSRRRLEQD